MDKDFVIDDIESMEIRGGAGDQVLWKTTVFNSQLNRNNSKVHIGPFQPSSIEFVGHPYFQCRYCDVIQKEFHSKCPNCGAPMEKHEYFISQALPISGERYDHKKLGVAAVYSTGVFELPSAGASCAQLLSELRESLPFIGQNH